MFFCCPKIIINLGQNQRPTTSSYCNEKFITCESEFGCNFKIYTQIYTQKLRYGKKFCDILIFGPILQMTGIQSFEYFVIFEETISLRASLSAQSPVSRKIYRTFLFTLLSSPPPPLIFGLPLYKNIYLYS